MLSKARLPCNQEVASSNSARPRFVKNILSEYFRNEISNFLASFCQFVRYRQDATAVVTHMPNDDFAK
jgi:hypothetical protein